MVTVVVPWLEISLVLLMVVVFEVEKVEELGLLELVEVVPIVVVVLEVLKLALRYTPMPTTRIIAITTRAEIPREIALFALANVETYDSIVRVVFETT